MGRTLSRVAGIVSAGALITAATAPAALAQTETTAPETTTTTAGSSEATTTTAPTTSETTTTTAPATSETTGTTTTPSLTDTVKTDAPDPTGTTVTSEPPKDDYQDNTGHGFVGLGGEGVLVIACAAGQPGAVATQYLSVTGGPDQDEADGRLWNYSVRVVDAPAGTTTAKFSWTCDGVEGNGLVEFEQEQPPVTTTTTTTTTSSTAASSTAPVTTATSTTAAGNAAPEAQVKVAPKGGVETGFGGTAW